MKDKIINFIKKIKIEDILILCGLASITVASFLISKIVGLYVLGSILIGLGILIMRRG